MYRPSFILPVILFATATTVYASGITAEAPAETANKLAHTVPFLTLRNKTGSDDVADFFAGERDILRTGYCDISRTQYQGLKSIAAVSNTAGKITGGYSLRKLIPRPRQKKNTDIISHTSIN